VNLAHQRQKALNALNILVLSAAVVRQEANNGVVYAI